MTSASDVFAALRTLDEACGQDHRQFRWRVRLLLRDRSQPQQRAASTYPYGVRLNICGYTDAADPGRLCRLDPGHVGRHSEWRERL